MVALGTTRVMQTLFRGRRTHPRGSESQHGPSASTSCPSLH
jgi:hypothetical protein